MLDFISFIYWFNLQPANQVILLGRDSARDVANSHEAQNFDQAANYAKTMVDALGVATEKVSQQ